MIKSGRHRARSGLLCSVAAGAVVLVTPHGARAGSPALPSGGVVRSGQAVIAASKSGALTINQSSGTAIIDWSSFSIGQGGSVQFNNGSGATLNRVLSGGPISSIDGRLSATGSVFLINPSGVIIGKNGVVKVGGTFAASTLDLEDSAFLKRGALTFSGESKASVVNLGKVEALGGDVVLAAAVVKNAGSIVAPNGDVGLLAGYAVTLSDQADRDGLFTVQIGGAGTSVTDKGLITATAAELRANGGNIYALAGDTASVIKATQVTQQGGQIFLTAPGGTVSVASGVTLDASGAGSGGGGHILVDSADTSFHGTALARGGALGGDGGLIETSGGVLDFSGARVDTTAARGATGTWLLDPYDLTVDATGAQAIENGLASNNVVVQTTASSATTAYGTQNSSGAGDITVAAPITWSSANTLTLDAYHSLHVDAPITVAGGGGVVIKTNSVATDGDYDFGLTSTGFSGSISFASGQTGQSLTISNTPYTLLHSMSDVQNINTGLTGNYALATSLNASGTTYAQAIIGGLSSPFSGTFEGLGNVIKNLTINDTSAGGGDGLFGATSGAVRDIGVVGGSVIGAGNSVGGLTGWQLGGTITSAYATEAVSGNNWVGGLAGYLSGGTIANAYATGTVHSVINVVGGLAGYERPGATITNAYATGAVSGNGWVGGLVGSFAGTITDAYATGAVSGGSHVGGLAGYQGGTITNAYATGAISANSYGGGLVGGRFTGTVTNGYYDIETTGTSTSYGGAGLTTAQLQGGLPSGFSSSIWGAGSGLYPYLTSFFPNGVQAVSGAAYKDSGLTPAASGANGAVTVSLDAGGGLVGRATTGANGYYYIMLPAGAVSAGQGLVSYTTANSTTGAADAASYAESATGAAGVAVSSLDLYGGWKVLHGGAADTSMSGLALRYAAVADSTAPTTLANLEIDSAAANFTFDVPLSLSSGTLSLSSAGAVGQSAALSVGALQLSGGGDFSLTNASNQIGTLAGTTGNLSLADSQSLSLGSVSSASGASLSGVASTGTVSLSAAGSLTIAANAGVTAGGGGDVTLAATGAFINNGGASAVSVSGAGRWLIYSSAPGGDTFGGLDSTNTAVWGTAAGDSVGASGNRYAFAYAPTLTVTTTDDSKIYGTDATSELQSHYTITGEVAGVTGAFLGGGPGVYSGAPLLTASGAGAGANVADGPTTISASLGTLTSTDGYGFGFTNTGLLTINPKALTWSVSDTFSTYGTPAILGSATLTGVVSGDTVTGTVGAFASGGSAVALNATTNAGSYQEAVTGLGGSAAGNYILAASGNTNGTLTINPKSLTISIIGDPTKTYDGSPRAALDVSNYQISGLVGSQTASITQTSGTYDSADVASATTVTASLPGQDISGSNGFLASNYTLPTSVSGAGQITPKTLTWTVADVSYAYGTAPTPGAATLSGVLAGDQDSVSGVVGVFTSGGSAVALNAETSAGTYVEQVTALSGSAAPNYQLASSGGAAGVLTIDAVSPSSPVVSPPFPLAPANGANTNASNSAASNGGQSFGLGFSTLSGAPAGGARPSSAQGSSGEAPYPGNLNGWGDIRYESESIR